MSSVAPLYFPPFDVRGDPSSLGQRWAEYVERYNNFLLAMDITDPTRQRALLLHFSGEDVYRIFKTLPETGEAKDYKKATAALKAYFQPQKNIEYEKYTFRQATQQVGETLDTYHTRLQQLATYCEFHDKDAEVKSQIVSGCSSKRVRRHALREPKLPLPELLAFGRSIEISEDQATGIEKEINVAKLQIDTVKRQPMHAKFGRPRRPQQKQKTCFNCGGNYPHTHQKPCPAQGQRCRSCNKLNHFAKVCRSSKSQSRYTTQPVPPLHQGQQVQTVREPCAKQMDSLSDSSDQETELLFGVGAFPQLPKAVITIANCPVEILIDSGASINILDKTTFAKIKETNPLITLLSSSTKVFAYASDTPLALAGKFTSEISTKDAVTVGTFYVAANSKGNLLSFKSATDLKLLHVNVDTVHHASIGQHQLTPPTKIEQNSSHTGNLSTDLVQEFSELFNGVGKLKDTTIKLHIDENVPSVAQPARRIPFHIRKALDKALDELEEHDIIEPSVGATPWVSPLVVFPKPNNPDEVRVCIDMRQANKAIQRERHPTPTVEEILHDLNGASVFSKLDLNKGYHQLELDPKSRGITTFATHRGLYRYQRLAFGITSAAEIFQYQIQTALAGIPGCRNLSDDIIVYGKTQQEHDATLRNVFQRLRDKGLTLNRSKCVFNKGNLNFYGYTFSADGMKADDKKLQAIKDAPVPQHVGELRSFLGLVNYVSRFIRDFATIAAPLRDLTKKSTNWTWNSEHQIAFDKLKESLTSKSVVAYFDPQKETEIIVDASPVGLGAILMQKTVLSHGEEQSKVCAYASRTLSDVERRYSQTEKEALAIVWACEKFHLYIYGEKFNIVTDHKALEMIFGNASSRPPARIERWNLRLQNYNFTVSYRPGRDNPADFMSRHPTQVQRTRRNSAEEYVNFLERHAVPIAMSYDEILQETEKDPTLSALKMLITSGKLQQPLQESRFAPDVNVRELQTYAKVQDELVLTEKGSILIGTKILIPETLRSRVIELAHEGHQGIVKTKSLLREKVWFPGIDNLVENVVKRCIPCQASTAKEQLVPYKMSTLPRGPWDKVSIDFSGPYPNGEYILVVIDEYSLFPELEIVRSTNGKTVIPKLNRIFSTFGIPRVVKTDNGSPFQGHCFRDFSNELGFRHRKITPHWPRANGEAERFMRTLNKTVEAAQCENKSWENELFTFLRNYRATPHSSTGQTPAFLLFGRNIGTKLPQYTEKPENDQALRQKDTAAKEIMKQNAERKKEHKVHDFQNGDRVLVQSQNKGKLKTFYDPKPYHIVDIKGSMITAARPGHQITRNSSWFKKLPYKQQMEEEEDDCDYALEKDRTLIAKRYPVRNRKQTEFYFGTH